MTVYDKEGFPEDLLSNKKEGSRRVKIEATDYFADIAFGLRPGFSTRGIIGRNPNIQGGADTETFEDAWAAGGTINFPVAEEEWEVSSTSDNDTLGGTGAQNILINYLDGGYNKKSIVPVDLDGQNAVTLNSDMFRPDGSIVIFSGSGRGCEGDIIIRDSITGDVRQTILAGQNSSQDGHFSTSAGTSTLIIQSLGFFPFNNAGNVRSKIIFFGSNTEVINATVPVYQNQFVIDVKARFRLPEKTDIIFQLNSTNVGADATLIQEIIVADNNFLIPAE